MNSDPSQGQPSPQRHVVLIACAKRKGSRRAKAGDLYRSDLFRKSLAYARSFKPDAIHVLSAKHGLLALDAEVEPYELTLNTLSAGQVAAWAATVIDQIRQLYSTTEDRFTFLAAEKYRKYLLPHIPHHDVPLRGLGIGQQLRFLKESLR